jgi:hypothetical protein
MAGGFAVVGCLLLVAALFDAMDRMHSADMRDTVGGWLAGAPSGVTISVDQMVAVLRGLVLVNGALAAAGTVLAVYALLRHNGARIGFTVVAGVLLVTGPLSGSVLPVVVAISAGMLWSRPARDWFAGREPRPVTASVLRTEEDRPSPGEGWSPEPVPEPAAPAQQPPPSSYPFGQPPPQRSNQPVAGWPPPQYGVTPAYPGPSPRPNDKRPVTVTVAAVLTWIFSAITALVYLLVIVMMTVAKGRLLEALNSNPDFARLDISTNDLLAVLWVMSAVAIVWSLAAMVLAFLVVRRQNWARITLVVSAAVTALVSVAAFPVGLPTLVAAVATIALLFTGGANAWFSRSGGGYPVWDRTGQQPPYSPPEQPEPPKNVW